MANIVGDITFGVGADTRGLDKSLDRLRAFGRTVDQIASQQVGASQSITRAYNAQEKAMRSAIGRVAEMQRAIKASSAGPAQMGQMLGQATNSLNAYTRALSSGQLNSVQFTRATDRFNISMGKLKNNLTGFKPPTQATSSFATVLKDLSSTAVLAIGPLSGLSSRFSALNAITNRSTIVMAGFLAGAAAVTVGITKLSMGAIDASLQLGKINGAFLAATGSSTLARAEFDYTVGVAQKMGLELGSTAQSYARLTAASRGTRLEGKATRDIFEATAMASTALRLSADDTTGILKALEQMMSKGTIQAEELRGQLGDRMPGAFNLMASALGVTTRELGEMMKAGDVLADEALPKLAKQMALVYGGPAAAQADMLQASINRLATQQLLFNKAFDDATGVSNTYKAAIEGITGVLKGLSDNMGTIVKVFIIATSAVAGYGAAMAIAFAISKWTAIIAVVAKLRTGILLLNAAMLLNPVALAGIAVGLAAAGAAWVIYGNKIEAANKVQRDSTISSTSEFIDSQRKTISATREATDVYIEEVGKRIMATRLGISALDDEVRALERQKQMYGGTVLAPSDKKLDAARRAYNEEGQAIITMKRQLEELNKIRTNAYDPSKEGTTGGKPSNDNAKVKLDKFDEAIDDLEIIKQRTAEINALPDYWLDGTKSLDEFNKSLNNGKQLEAYHDKLVLAGASTDVVAQKMREMSEALEESDAAELRLKAIEDRAKELEQFGGSALDTFGGFLESLGDETKDVSESFDDMVTSIVGSLRKLVIQQTILDPLKEALFGTSGGSGSGGGLWGALSSAIGNGIGSLFGGGSSVDLTSSSQSIMTPSSLGISGYRARGGSVMAGRAYMVGEKGPEPFIPQTNGSIIPNGALGGASMNVTIINNSKATVSARQSSNGQDLEIMVDDMMARNLSNPSSQSSKAIRNSGNVIVGR